MFLIKALNIRFREEFAKKEEERWAKLKEMRDREEKRWENKRALNPSKKNISR